MRLVITLTICLSILLPINAGGAVSHKKAPKDSVTVEIDTNYIKKYKVINDYDLIGVDYGVSLSSVNFTPARTQVLRVLPYNIGILYTHFCKLFGYMPYFAFQGGFYYTREGYEFEADEDGYRPTVENAYKATMQVLEIPILAYFHYDFWKMRIQASIGVFGGYRMSIKREYQEGLIESAKTYEYSFAPEDYRWDYGIKGGVGFAFILDPIEIHLNASLKYSWMNLYHPDYVSEYYYKWAYPMNIIVSAGVHYQLTKRIGRSRKELKLQARSEIEQLEKEAISVINTRDSLSRLSASADSSSVTEKSVDKKNRTSGKKK